MAYRSDLYNIANIIGYSGQLHDFPTVYFRCDTLGRVGRITQRHRYSQNVGRTAPKSTYGYTAQNERVRGRLVYVERSPLGGNHTSRNAFVPLQRGGVGRVNQIDLATLAILAQAIRNVPYEKQMHTFSRAQRDQINQARRNKSLVFEELDLNNDLMCGLRPSEVRHNAGLWAEFAADPRVLDKGYAANARRGY